MDVHVKELECKYLKFKLNPRERKTIDIEFWFRGPVRTGLLDKSQTVWSMTHLATCVVC